MDVTVREATVADVPALVEGNLRMALETEALALDRERLELGVRAALADPNKGWYLVAELDGRVAGQLMVTREWSDWRNGWMWWIQSVYVSADFRRRGIYRALESKVRELAAAAGDVLVLRLYVEQGNRAAQAAYRGLGMTRSHYQMWEAPLTSA